MTRIYDDRDFKPSVPELVIVHMVFATIYFQYGIRNREEPEKHAQLNELSNKHYHWSLSKFFDLAASQSLTAVQAMAMIVAHTRNFPKPGCSSIIANFAFMKAVELNLHKAVKIPGGGTTLENEVRKRVWWAILGVLITLNGRLGRPMPISLEEFDVDFPIAIKDEYLGENGVLDASKIGHCDYHVGLMGFKVTPLFMEMYSKIYGMRRDPSRYVQVVRELEQAMNHLLENLPDELRVDKCKPSNRIFALYTQAFCLEFQLCLRHPSVCMTDDPKICAENTRICEDTARKLLKVVGSLLSLKSLDTTWYQLAVYVAAIFSSLVAHWQRRYETTAHQVSSLREEMSLWLKVIGEIGYLLGKIPSRLRSTAPCLRRVPVADRGVGTGTRLTTEVGAIIERTISWIEKDMVRKPTTPAGQVPTKPEPPPSYQQAPFKPKQQEQNNSVAPVGGPVNARERSDPGTANGNSSSYYDHGVSASMPATSYPLGYGDHTTGGASTQQNGTGTSEPVDNAHYLYAAASAVTAATATNAGATGEQTAPAENPLIAFASQATQHVAEQAAESWTAQNQLAAQQSVAANTWHDWTAAIADSQDRYSANALLNLGTGRAGDAAAAAVANHAHQGDAMGNSHADQWPLLLFHNGTGTTNE